MLNPVKLLPYLLLAIALLFSPQLMPLAAEHGLTPQQIADRITYGTPTATPIPRLRLIQEHTVEPDAPPRLDDDVTRIPSPVPSLTSQVTPPVRPSATPDAQTVRYWPPPKVSRGRDRYIGHPDTVRGMGYTKNLTLRVGSFSAERGQDYSFWSSHSFEMLARDLQEEYPEVEAYIFDELTEDTLSQVDLFIATANKAQGGYHFGLTLSEGEKVALRRFVEQGGWLLLLLDPGFNMGGIDNALVEMAEIFEVTLTGDLPYLTSQRPIEEGHLHRVTTGPWGTVSQVKVKNPISFSDLGPYAEPLAINDAAYPMLAVIEPGRIQPGSGSVLLVGDMELFQRIDNFANDENQNDVLFYNFVDLALQAKAYAQGVSDILPPETTPAITPTPAGPRPTMPPFPTSRTRTHVGGTFVPIHRGVTYLSDVPLHIGTFAGREIDLQNSMDIILREYPEADHTTFEMLTNESVSEMDMLILASRRYTPLSLIEQQTLYEYVTDGGCAVLLLGDPKADPDAQVYNMVAPFEIDVTISPEAVEGRRYKVLPYEPAYKPLLDGPWGLVPDVSNNAKPIALVNAGPYGETLLYNEYGGHMVLIEPDAIRAGSGPVIVIASMATFHIGGDRVYFNDILTLNTIDYCHQHTIASSVKK